MSQLDFNYTVRKYDAEGVPFRSNLHVPETHPITGVMFCEREDHGHVLKVRVVCDIVHKHYRYTIQKSLRELLSTRNQGPKGVKLEKFKEALFDQEANLTYSSPGWATKAINRRC